MPASLHLAGIEELLKRTTSRCPLCLAACAAEVWRTGGDPGRVILKRFCPEHGEHSECIAADARFYWISQGKPGNRGCDCAAGNACRGSDLEAAGTLGRNAAGRGAGPFETLSTCLALIEVVHSCNLPCPTCYAASPIGVGQKTDAVPLAGLKSRIQGVIDRKGRIEILQLSGGEPTLHPDLAELLAWAQEHPRIDYVLLNTNGLRIARDDDVVEVLRAAAARDNIQLYLQFDGPQAEGQIALRGTDLRGLKRQALDRCGEIGLPVTLAMTVTPENLSCVWAAVEFGLGYPQVRGVSFQPLFHSGRVDSTLPAPVRPVQRLHTSDIVLAAIEQSGGRLRAEDFTPLPCGDPNCATIGYLLRVRGGVHSISEFIDFTQLQGFLRDRIRYELADLERCGCDSEPLGALLKQFELDESNTFRLFVKPFMDAWTWDEDRIDRCCTHVIRPDGRLDSFCRYYSGFADVRAAP